MKFLLIFFMVSLIFPTDVWPFEVKKAGRAVPASRLDEIQKSASMPASDQMAKMQAQVLQKIYEKAKKGDETASDGLIQDVVYGDGKTATASDEGLTKQPGFIGVSSDVEDQKSSKKISSSFDDERKNDETILGKSKQTQIEAHFASKIKQGTILDRVRLTFAIDDRDELVAQMIDRERLHDDSFAFYHACNPELQVLQDLYKRLYEFFAIKGKINNFVFFRWVDPIFDTYDSVDTFLNREIRARGIVDDNIRDVKAYVLSTNISPFGGIGNPGESTWDYFKTCLSHFDPTAFLPHFFDQMNFDKKFVDDFKQLYPIIERGEGSLYQIFIPKDKADQIAYLSWIHGLPLDPRRPEFIAEVFERVYSGRPEEIKPFIKRVLEAHEKGDSEFKKEEEALLEAVNSGKFKVSTFLENFKSVSEKFRKINEIQARLLFTNSLLLNPDSGIIIYRYNNISPDQLQEYENRLDDIVGLILIDWLEKNSNPETTSLSGKELDRVKNLLAQMKAGREFEGQEQSPAGKDILSKVRILQELKGKASEIAASSEKQRDALSSLDQRLEQERQERIKEMVQAKDKKGSFLGNVRQKQFISSDDIDQKKREIDQLEQLLQQRRRELRDAIKNIESKQSLLSKPLPEVEEKKSLSDDKLLSTFEALERQRKIREEKLRKGEPLNLDDEPKIVPGTISQKRLDDLVDTLEYKKKALPTPGKLTGEQVDVKNQLEKIFGKKQEVLPEESAALKPLPTVGKVNPAIQKELEKFFASQKKAPKAQLPSKSQEKPKEVNPAPVIPKIHVKPGEIPPPPPLPSF